VTIVAVARTAITAAAHLHAVRRQAMRHTQTARLVGRPLDPDQVDAVLAHERAHLASRRTCS
jgi:hypothetical protein